MRYNDPIPLDHQGAAISTALHALKGGAMVATASKQMFSMNWSVDSAHLMISVCMWEKAPGICIQEERNIWKNIEVVREIRTRS